MEKHEMKLELEPNADGMTVDVHFTMEDKNWRARITTDEADKLQAALNTAETHGDAAKFAALLDFLYFHESLPVEVDMADDH
jgi:hypothetical protein